METDAERETLSEIARAAAGSTPRGALLRRRVIAICGFALLVAGFLVAVGAGRLVAALVLLGAVGGIVFLFVRRLRRGVDLSAVRHAGAAAKQAGAAAKQKSLEEIRRRRQASGERANGNRQREQASRLNTRGAELRKANKPAAAVEAHQAALDIIRTLDDPAAEALTLNSLALALGQAGREQEAIDNFDEAATILRRIDDEHHEGQVLANLGLLHGRGGRQEQAVYCLQAALEKLDSRSPAFRRVEEQLRRAS
jgi:tetratricopeptide (TPR) repeat protein